MKGYTTMEQSKKLLELGLSPETADMHYINNQYPGCVPYNEMLNNKNPWLKGIGLFPCWSLSALLIILAKKALEYDDDGSVSLHSFMGTWSLNMFDCPIEYLDGYDNPIDICVDMLKRISENNFIKK